MCKEDYNLDQNLLGNMICDNFDLGIHLDHYIDENGVKRFVSEVVEYVSYGNEGTVVNPLFTRETTITKRNGRFFYDVSYKYGKMTKRLFNKLASAKVLDSEIEKFIKEEYYEEKNIRIFNKIKRFFNNLSNKFFFGKYRNTYEYINKKTSKLEYLLKFIFIFIVIVAFLYLLFNNWLYSLIVSFVLTIFFINEIVLNNKN